MQIDTTLSFGRIFSPHMLQQRRALEAAAILTLRALRGWVGRAVGRWWAHAQAKRDRAALLSLPEHVLRDLGDSR